MKKMMQFLMIIIFMVGLSVSLAYADSWPEGLPQPQEMLGKTLAQVKQVGRNYNLIILAPKDGVYYGEDQNKHIVHAKFEGRMSYLCSRYDLEIAIYFYEGKKSISVNYFFNGSPQKSASIKGSEMLSYLIKTGGKKTGSFCQGYPERDDPYYSFFGGKQFAWKLVGIFPGKKIKESEVMKNWQNARVDQISTANKEKNIIYESGPIREPEEIKKK